MAQPWEELPISDRTWAIARSAIEQNCDARTGYADISHIAMALSDQQHAFDQRRRDALLGTAEPGLSTPARLVRGLPIQPQQVATRLTLSSIPLVGYECLSKPEAVCNTTRSSGFVRGACVAVP
jgi:hypothetical protein